MNNLFRRKIFPSFLQLFYEILSQTVYKLRINSSRSTNLCYFLSQVFLICNKKIRNLTVFLKLKEIKFFLTLLSKNNFFNS